MHPKAIGAQAVIAQKAPSSASKASMAVVTPQRESDQAAPPWLAELLNDSDPQVRLQGLDAWAQHPGETLDVVTYALVDTDEAVRVRAQALFEEALARR